MNNTNDIKLNFIKQAMEYATTGEVKFEEPLQRAYRLSVIVEGIIERIKEEGWTSMSDAMLHGLKCGINNLISDLESLCEE